MWTVREQILSCICLVACEVLSAWCPGTLNPKFICFRQISQSYGSREEPLEFEWSTSISCTRFLLFLCREKEFVMWICFADSPKVFEWGIPPDAHIQPDHRHAALPEFCFIGDGVQLGSQSAQLQDTHQRTIARHTPSAFARWCIRVPTRGPGSDSWIFQASEQNSICFTFPTKEAVRCHPSFVLIVNQKMNQSAFKDLSYELNIKDLPQLEAEMQAIAGVVAVQPKFVTGYQGKACPATKLCKPKSTFKHLLYKPNIEDLLIKSRGAVCCWGNCYGAPIHNWQQKLAYQPNWRIHKLLQKIFHMNPKSCISIRYSLLQRLLLWRQNLYLVAREKLAWQPNCKIHKVLSRIFHMN